MKSLSLIPLLLLLACETEAPTKGVVVNGFTADQDLVVHRVWWESTYFANPLRPGETSPEERTVPETGIAYAVIERKDQSFVVMKSKEPLSVARGELLYIVVSDETFTGNCAANAPLSQEDAEFLTVRIFPGEFANAKYDAKTCTTSR